MGKRCNLLDYEKRRFVLIPMPTARASGFTIIEMMIAIAIIAIAAVLGIPSYKAWIHNTQIRNAAESMQIGLKRARSEAVGRNSNVSFALIGTDSSWVITDVATAAPIETRAASEGSKNITLTTLPAIPPATTITFSNLGSVIANADASPTLTQVNIDSSLLAAAESRDLRVTVGIGGNSRMCDPDPGLAVTDPRKC